MFFLIAMLISVAISAAIGAVLLMIIAPFTADRKPDFEEAFKAMFIAYICQFVAGAIVGLCMLDADPATTQLAGAGVGIIVLTFVLAYAIEATIPRALLTAAVLTGLGVLLGMAWDALAASL